MKSIIHKDCRSSKYKMQVIQSKKGKGSYRRNKRVENE
jgi:stalled ribosome alternative rescue factor ArfA